jgi:hypothetical protein
MNQLTPEQLDMIKRLQPLFKEVMGEWPIPDDQYAHPNNNFKILTFTQEAYDSGARLFNRCVRIPKPIDWQNPERGLWCMLKEDKKFVSLFYSEKGFACQVHKINSPILYSYEAPDPFTALLKALCAQENV